MVLPLPGEVSLNTGAARLRDVSAWAGLDAGERPDFPWSSVRGQRRCTQVAPLPEVNERGVRHEFSGRARCHGPDAGRGAGSPPMCGSRTAGRRRRCWCACPYGKIQTGMSAIHEPQHRQRCSMPGTRSSGRTVVARTPPRGRSADGERASGRRGHHRLGAAAALVRRQRRRLRPLLPRVHPVGLGLPCARGAEGDRAHVHHHRLLRRTPGTPRVARCPGTPSGSGARRWRWSMPSGRWPPARATGRR